jgi:transcriptional regulator with XRE-family HTH domain
MGSMGERAATDDKLERFGARLAVLRKRKKWSQERLALESGIARSYLGGVERGARNLGVLNVLRLAETLGVKPYVLFDFDDELPA